MKMMNYVIMLFVWRPSGLLLFVVSITAVQHIVTSPFMFRLSFAWISICSRLELHAAFFCMQSGSGLCDLPLYCDIGCLFATSEM